MLRHLPGGSGGRRDIHNLPGQQGVPGCTDIGGMFARG